MRSSSLLKNRLKSSPSWLSKEQKIRYGAFYTPGEVVKRVKEVVLPYKSSETVLLDPAGGCGAFVFEFLDWDYRVADVDPFAVEYLKKNFDAERVFFADALSEVSRKKYKISESAFLVVVGNPPYNDCTSFYKKGRKGSFRMDPDVFDRDLGIAFLKAAAKLKADVVCFLHPMSYLIKKANFERLKKFFQEYVLKKAYVFPSFVFDGTSKTSGFPVLIALYERGGCFTWDDLLNFSFKFLCSKEEFKLNSIQTVDGVVNKYPKKEFSPIFLYFHTFRDINSLLRNRDFLLKPSSLTIPLNLENFPYYAYLVAMKYYILEKGRRKFWFYGNFSPLIELNSFEKLKYAFVRYAVKKAKTIPDQTKLLILKQFSEGSLRKNDLEKVEDYFKRLFKYVFCCCKTSFSICY